MGDFNTYWRMTINNPDERDYALVRQGYPDDIRKIIWTPEEGENGTPHIQAFIRLQRNQTLTFVKKLYPKAHFKPCSKDDHIHATHDYAQKNDTTTAGLHHIVINDPQRDVLGAIEDILELWFVWQWRERYAQEMFTMAQTMRDVQETGIEWICQDVARRRRALENEYVERVNIRHSYLILSPSYERMWERFGNTIISRWWNRKWTQFVSEE